jgi:hypothetical protein
MTIWIQLMGTIEPNSLEGYPKKAWTYE